MKARGSWPHSRTSFGEEILKSLEGEKQPRWAWQPRLKQQTLLEEAEGGFRGNSLLDRAGLRPFPEKLRKVPIRCAGPSTVRLLGGVKQKTTHRTEKLTTPCGYLY